MLNLITADPYKHAKAAAAADAQYLILIAPTKALKQFKRPEQRV